jgi:hypothetical protein
MPITATLTVSLGLAAREPWLVDFSQGPAIRPAAPALLRKLRRSVISVFSFDNRWGRLVTCPTDCHFFRASLAT